MVASASARLLGSPPIPRTRLIGREPERVAARSSLIEEAVPLLTLTGSGGVGKTRLALTIAQDVGGRFAHGLVWVDFAPLTDPALVAGVVSRSLGIVQVSSDPVDVQLVDQLHAQQILLMFDNCEHLLVAVADLAATLLAHCPALQILATSRAPLRTRGEHELIVMPLPVPRSGDQDNARHLAQNAAVALFLERARAVNAVAVAGDEVLPDVAAICRRVDGLPLAIELAAARTRLLSPQSLLARLEQRLPFLTGGARDAPARQRTLRDTIDWSYDLLTAPEQAVFQRLAVFAGGFTLDAAQAVASDDAALAILPSLEQLADHHLIHLMASTREPRFTMLETIREFGLERLEEIAEAEATRDRHARFFLQLVDQLDAFWAPFMPNAQQILDQLEIEHSNLRAALSWMRESSDVAHQLELAGKLYFFWQLRGHIREGREWLEWGLGHDARVPPSARAAGQISLAGILFQQGEFARALALCDESIRLFQQADDAIGVAHACECAIPAAYNSGQLDRAASYIDQALATLTMVSHLPWVTGLASHLTHHRGMIAMLGGQLATAESLFSETVEAQRALARETGVEHPYACWPLNKLGNIDCIMGHRSLGLSRLQAALDHAWRFQEQTCVVASLMNVARILATEGRWREAAQLFGAAEAWCEQSGFHFWDDHWLWERAYGLPEPWQRGDEPLGAHDWMRTASVAYGSQPLPPLPDPAAAAEIWSAGRRIPIEEAVAQALDVDLSAPPTSFPREAIVLASPIAALSLSPREHDVLAWLCQRLTDPQIAERLFLSPRTVESHVSSLLRKLDVENRRDAAAAAVRLGLV